MKNSEKTLSPEESLDLISKTIANFKRNYKSDSYAFLLWGWIIIIASLSHFVIIKYLVYLELYNKINLFSLLNWGIFIVIGYIYAWKSLVKLTGFSEFYGQLPALL